jgi:hypothetical protein
MCWWIWYAVSERWCRAESAAEPESNLPELLLPFLAGRCRHLSWHVRHASLSTDLDTWHFTPLRDVGHLRTHPLLSNRWRTGGRWPTTSTMCTSSPSRRLWLLSAMCSGSRSSCGAGVGVATRTAHSAAQGGVRGCGGTMPSRAEGPAARAARASARRQLVPFLRSFRRSRLTKQPPCRAIRGEREGHVL